MTNINKDKNKRDIESVLTYWNSNSVHSVEFKKDIDIKTYVNEIDSLRWAENERYAREKFYEFGGVHHFY